MGGGGNVDTVDSKHPQKADIANRAKENFLKQTFIHANQCWLRKEYNK